MGEIEWPFYADKSQYNKTKQRIVKDNLNTNSLLKTQIGASSFYEKKGSMMVTHMLLFL